MPTKVIVCGAAGRMGKMLLSVAHSNPDSQVVAAIEVENHPATGQDAGAVAGLGPIDVPITTNLADVIQSDVILLDFTTANASLDHLRVAVTAGAGAVIGSTGFTSTQDEELKNLAAKTRTVVAPNMSIGVNVLLGAVRQVARALGNSFDVEIVELHHHHKKDAPSGTALALGRAAAEALNRPFPESAVHGREGQVGARTPDEIGIMALRAGDATGDHTVVFGGIGERIELIHRSHSRECFASGAVRAAIWLSDRSAGLYSMADVLSLT